MKLKYLDTLIEAQSEVAAVPSLTFSPNGRKIAVATADRNILLFDEKGQRRDKFSTKPVESKYGKKSYAIKAVAFSPDSTRLAVGQTDNIVFVYRLGETWDEKKVICNKFAQSSSVSAMSWPEENRLVIGLIDGRVRSAQSSNNKCSTLYNTGLLVTALAHHPNRHSFLSAHEDGSIILFSFDSRTQARVCVHSTAPYSIVLTNFGILAAGSDRRIVSYTEQGRILQQFDYSRDPHEKEFSVAVLDPSGHNAVFGSYDRLRLMSWNQRRGAWDENDVLDIRDLYTVTALSWKSDGSSIVCGSLTGAVLQIDCCLRRTLLKNQFETTYVSPSQVVIRDVNSDQRCTVRSAKGLNITDIRVMGRTNRYAIAYTPNTLVLTDMQTDKSSEIAWSSGGNEKFYLDNDNVAMIINAGEISLVEYGRDEIAGWIRTEKVNPHLISVRLNERRRRNPFGSTDDLRRVAYLLDVHTISIVNLVNNNQIAQITHGSAIDWLELNESANKLLYRDVRSSLYLFEIDSETTTNMINFCSYVQWVPQSDVVVAQSNDQLCVWYNTDHVDQVIQTPVQGDVEMVLRDQNRTEVIVQENNARVAYELDSTMIEFGTAIDELDLERALVFLEQSERDRVEVGAMWRQLANVALGQGQLLIAQRCFAGLRDIARVRFLEKTIEMADDAAKQIGGDGTQHFKVRARLALIKKQFKEAERIYLENNALDEAIEMYQTIHKWESAIELAKATNYRDLENLKAKYYRNLYETGQEEKAAQIKESEGDYTAALDLYLKSNQPALAAKLVMENSAMYNDDTVVERVALELVKAEIFDRAGELFEQTKQFQRALESYRKGKNFNKAIHVARFSFPEQVIQLEEEWGDSLMQEGQYDAAVSHYIEAGNSLKATDAAISAKEWDKALEILRNLESGPETDKFYARIANHFEAEGQYTEAEKYYIEANMPKEAIEMYNKASKWAEAYKLATEFMEVDATQAMYLEKAEELEHAGRLKEAEDLYISIGDPTRAIAMYKEANRLEEMMRLVERFHTDRVNDTHKRLAEDLEDKGDFQAAEEQYLLAGDWKAAVNMYKEHEQWPDAYRVAKAEGSERAHKQARLNRNTRDKVQVIQVVYMWAKSLGGDAAVRLLQRYGMLGEAIDMAIEKGEFEFGFELCRLGANERLADVQSSYALQLEDQGDFAKAERFYLEAGKAREAVLMHMHNQDWQSAERLASAHCTDMLVDIYISQARAALEVRDHEKAESYLLRANKADIILKYYKETGMWQDALRIAKEYMPDMHQQLQNEYDEELLRSGAKGAQSFMHQALQWEREGEYQRAIECYMKVDEPVTSDVNQISTAWAKAGELVIRFLKDDGAVELNRIGHRLSELGQSNAAGELYLHANKPNEAIQAFIEGQEWAKAKTVAKELLPEMEESVDEAYREFLRNQGRVGELIDVDVVSAIDILVERGQWEKALMTARQQNHRPLLDKYLAMRATELINMDQLLEAVNLFEKFGTSTNTQNFNIYKKLIDSLVNSRDASYDMYAGLRNMIVDLLDKIAAASDDVDSRIAHIFERYLYVLNFYALRKALEETGTKEAERIRLHESVALVRYIDLLQPDKVFYDAGMACRKAGGDYENMAFLFLNQYLDVVEAIEANDPSIVDNSVFEGTDVPQQFSLPQSGYLSPEEHEEVKEWVLSVSVDQRVQPALSVDENGRYEASTVDQDGNVSPVCVISGYPVLHAGQDFGNGKMADSDAWQAFVTLTKTNASDELFDVQQFLTRWSGTPSLSH